MNIADAAKVLGVSTDTVRRRMKAGIIKAERVHTAQGYRWDIVDLGAHTESLQHYAIVTAMQDRIDSLERELEARRREIQQLHGLLDRKALPGPGSVPWYKRIFGR